MQYKKIMMLAILFICLLTVSTVNAAENSADDIVSVENQENTVITEVNNDLTSNVDENILSTTPKTFTDLDSLIRTSGSDVYLEDNYTFNADSDDGFSEGISVSQGVTIHGNGFTIDANNSARIFKGPHQTTDGVLFRDIVCVNGNSFYGGAILYGSAVNCTFINNSADHGGAMFGSSVVNCTFIGNSAIGGDGGACYGGYIEDCTFINNTASGNGGAIYIGGTSCGSVVNCTFIGNSAENGGALSHVSAVNCTFINNTAIEKGGAMSRYLHDCFAENCTFIGNSARYGGAVQEISTENCTFINNTASYQGGAMSYGSAGNCTFINNSAGGAGAVYEASCVNCTFIGNSANYSGGAIQYAFAENCTFINNTAEYGGAMISVDAVNCTFIGNSAIKAAGAMSYGSARDCTFIGNSAIEEAGAILEGNAENCIFQDNYADIGGAMSGGISLNSTFRRNRANNEGGAVYDSIAKDCSFEYNSAKNGGAMSNGVAINCTFNDNNATDYGGAAYKSRVTTDSQFSNNHAPNGEDTYDVMWLEKKENTKSFAELNILINGVDGDSNETDIYLNDNYTFDLGCDLEFIGGITVDRQLTVHGNGFTIDGWGIASIFDVESSDSPTFKDIILVNGKNDNSGGAISGMSTVVNCTFIGNYADDGGAIYGCTAVNCTFINNSAQNYGGAMDYCDMDECFAVNCTFIGNYAEAMGGAVYGCAAVNCTFIGNSAEYGGATMNSCSENCTFINNTAIWYGGAAYDSEVLDSTFINNTANSGGASYQSRVSNCSFIDNLAEFGGAMYGGDAQDSTFINNTANIGGAIYAGSAFNCIFINNSANNGGASYQSSLLDCNFTDNIAAECGGAMHGGFCINSTFINNSAREDGGAVYDVLVTNSTFESNSAKNGGAMSKGKAIRCKFDDNNATDYGGAVYDSKVSTGSQFSNNSAPNGEDTYNVTWFEKGDGKSFTDLIELIAGKTSDEVYLDDNYTFDLDSDFEYIIGIFLPEEMTIYGNGFTIDGDGVASIFIVDNDINVRFINITFANARSAEYGGAINGLAAVAVNCTFINNIAASGGAMFGGTAVNCTFINNNALISYGGAILYSSVVNCTFINNSAVYGGGACYVCEVMNSTFINNSAIWYGGAMYEALAENCILINNTACYGGAMYYSYAKICTFIGNSAEDGGAGYECEVTNCTFINNTAINHGGAMYECDYDDCIFEGNTARRGNDVYPTSRVAVLIVENFTSTYNSGEKLIINLTDVGIPINDANITIEIYENTSLIGTYNCLSGDGWVVNLNPGNYSALISFEGDEVYEPANTTASVTVNRIPTEISVDSAAADLKVNGEVDVGATLTPADAGILTFVSSNPTVAIVENGKIKALKEGNTIITVSFAGDDIYAAAESKYIDVTVSFRDASVSVNNSTLDLFVGGEFDLVATPVPGNLTVNFTSNNDSVVTVDADGKIMALAKGDAIVTVSVGGDGVYALNYTDVTVTVSKVPTEISVDTVSLDMFVGDGAVIAATLTPADAGNVTFTSSNEDVVIVDNDEGSVIAYGNGKGQAIITVSFAGDDKYAAAQNKTISVAVRLNDASVTVANDTLDLKVGETYAINATKNPDTILLDIDYTSSNNSVATVDENGIVTAVGEGTAIITVSVGDDEIYAINSTNVTVTVSKVGTVISVDAVSVAYKNTTGELVATIADADGVPLSVDLIVVFNGENCTLKADSNGQISVPIGVLTPKTYVATISYDGDDIYEASSTTADVVVTKADTVITAPDVTVDYGDENAKLVATLKNVYGNGLGVNVNVNLNGESYTVRANSKGQVFIPTASLAPGNYTATISYAGNVNYNPSSTTANIAVNKVGTVISAPDVTVAYKNTTGELVATIADADGVPLGVDLVVVFNGENCTLKADSNGQITMPIGVLTPKTYEATISYAGDDIYAASSATADVVVAKADTVITAADITVDYGDENAKLVATLKNVYGNSLGVNVNVDFNGEGYTVRANSKGQVFIPTASLAPGNYTATISYAGNVNYNPSSTTANIVVNKVGTVISVDNVSVVYKDTTGELVATIVDVDGNALSVDLVVAFNGETYSVKADSNGQITIPIGVLTPGTYAAAISYVGDDIYAASSATADVVVAKADTVIAADDVCVTYKGDAGELIATIKNAYGNSLGVNLNVNFNGENYVIKADSRGKITLPIGSSLTPGNYTATISYAGNVNYNPSSTTVNVVVDKADTVITANDVTVKCGDEKGKLVATLKNEYGNGLGVKVNVNLNGQDYTIKAESNGKIIIPTAGLDSGNYTATISYAGNVNYNPTTTTANIVVKP